MPAATIPTYFVTEEHMRVDPPPLGTATQEFGISICNDAALHFTLGVQIEDGLIYDLSLRTWVGHTLFRVVD